MYLLNNIAFCYNIYLLTLNCLMTKVAAFYVAAKAIEMSISEDFDMLWDELNESNYISFNSGFWLTD